MKIILISLGAILVLGINFVLYCCFVVASREDEYLEKAEAEMEWESDDAG